MYISSVQLRVSDKKKYPKGLQSLENSQEFSKVIYDFNNLGEAGMLCRVCDGVCMGGHIWEGTGAPVFMGCQSSILMKAVFLNDSISGAVSFRKYNADS